MRKGAQGLSVYSDNVVSSQKIYFTKLAPETVGKSLPIHAGQNLPGKEFRYLRPLWLQPPLIELIKEAKVTSFRSYIYTGQASDIIIILQLCNVLCFY